MKPLNEEFFYLVAHELRAPLRGMRSLSSLMHEDLEQGNINEAKIHLQKIDSRAQRLERMIDSLLQFSLSTFRPKSKNSFDTKALILNIFNHLKPTDVAIDLKIESSLPTLDSYQNFFEIVVSHLIQNAIKHRGLTKNLEISVKAEKNPRGWLFFFADNGPGIESKAHALVFEPFKSLKSRDEVEGSGLGLSTINNIFKTLGGEVFIETIEHKQGTCFKFLWPINESE